MEKSYSIKQNDLSLIITLNPRRPIVVIVGIGGIAIVYIIIAFIVFSMITSGSIAALDFGVFLALVVGILYTMLYLLVARAFIRRITQEEIITVTKDKLVLADKYILSLKKRTFELKHIKQIAIAGAESFTRHPLDGINTDLGFRGMEGLVQYQISDGKMILSYDTKDIKFGKNIPSWDGEEIIAAIESYTGRTFTLCAKPVIDIEVPRYRGRM